MADRFYIVDVFAERPYTGNQLAVVLTGHAMPDEQMQLIAAEMDYSETTFLSPVPDDVGGYRVRIFTPAREIAFAGHPILGTAWVLRRHLGLDAARPLHLNLAIGRIGVTFERSTDGREAAWFLAPPVTLGRNCDPEPIAAALGLSRGDIAIDAPVQQLCAGAAITIVPLRSLDALQRSKLDLAAFAPLAAEGFPPLVYLFCRETHRPGNDLCARFFFEAHGVREDAATGNGAAFLGSYLLEHRLWPGSDFSIRIEQGHEIRRLSLVLLRARMIDGLREVSVGGSVVPIVRGELL